MFKPINLLRHTNFEQSNSKHKFLYFYILADTVVWLLQIYFCNAICMVEKKVKRVPASFSMVTVAVRRHNT